MSLEILSFVLGPLDNNVYLLADPESSAAIVIDPGFDSLEVMDLIEQRGWRLDQIWITHAHFDHIAGVAAIARSAQPPIPIALHSDDLPLWRSGGGSEPFGITLEPGPEPSIPLAHGTHLSVGSVPVTVLHTPGHTPGHVCFSIPSQSVLLCGDLIFASSIGRTDLPGGSYPAIIESIRTQVLTLPDHTRLLSGHGSETTVGLERRYNPFLS